MYTCLRCVFRVRELNGDAVRVDPILFKKQLVTHFTRKLEKLGIQIDDESKSLIVSMVSHGVERMAHARVLDRHDKIIQVEAAINTMADSLVIQARQLGSYPKVNEKAFYMAKHDCCPQWPLC